MFRSDTLGGDDIGEKATSRMIMVRTSRGMPRREACGGIASRGRE